MSRSSDGPTPPEGVPTELVDALEELSDDELRKTLIYGQELLNAHEERGFPIEPAPGEDILRITEKELYTEVVKKVPCSEDCEECPHGPYLYHVSEETLPNGKTELHWKFLGDVVSEDD